MKKIIDTTDMYSWQARAICEVLGIDPDNLPRYIIVETIEET